MRRKGFNWVLRLLAIALLCNGLGGCVAIYKEIKGLIVEPEPVDSSVVAKWWDGPKIAPGVALIIEVGPVGSKPVQMQMLVDQKGEITLSYLLQNPVFCDGMTLEELKANLIKEYEVYLNMPQVTVTFAPYDEKGVSPWGTVTVLGEVNTPGPVNMPATMNLTVTRVLQSAGGIKQYADRSRIKVSRCDREGKITKYSIDLDDIGDGRVDKDMPLRAGDVVYVPEIMF